MGVRTVPTLVSASASAPNPFCAVSPALLRRFDVRGPRYTSYPTADRFHPGHGAAQHARHLRERDAAQQPLALYVHLPFCQSICYYCGCNKVVTRDRGKRPRYLENLLREIGMQTDLLRGTHRASQMHWGGGTPNYFDLDQMQAIAGRVRECFDVDADAEWSIEVDPRTLALDTVDGLAQMGFRRMSIGVQDFDPRVQRAINRIQSEACTDGVMRRARAQGFRSINLDLIYGLPLQHEGSFARTLDSLVALAPDRVALYNYAHLPALFKPQRRINEADLPSAEQRIALLSLAIERLTQAGYLYIGMDHFARPDDDLAVAQREGRLHRNFQGYSTHADSDLMAFGLSSISRVGSSYAQNAKDLESYYDLIEGGQLPFVRGVELSEDDHLRADLIQQLMCHFTLHMPSFGFRHRIAFEDYFHDELESMAPFVEAGLVELDSQHLHITPSGRFFVRNVCMAFDRYLRRPEMRQGTYSRAV